MKSANIQVSEWIVETLISHGIHRFIISPGSRSTPLTVAAARNELAITHTHFDERGAAYFALGCARATGKAAVLICTSGSAVANYFPAIIEAAMDNIPLVVLTADRPPELIGRGANQAIYQDQIFGRYPRAYENLAPPDQGSQHSDVLTQLYRLLIPLKGIAPGPVHLNCQFREPFLTGNEIQPQKIRYTPPPDAPDQGSLDLETLELIKKHIAKAQCGLLVIGRGVPPQLETALHGLARKWDVPLFADVQSGLRYDPLPHCINHYDLALLREQSNQQKPDLVLHFGGAFTSKRLLNYLNDDGIAYVSINATPEIIDPNHQVDLSLVGNLADILDKLEEVETISNPGWLTGWQAIDKIISHHLETQLCKMEQLSDPAIAYFLSTLVPAHQALLLGNSMPIRDMEMFASTQLKASGVYANRGTSGIDGLLATASGLAFGSGQPVTIFLGDLSLLHDLNSLALIQGIEQPVIVIVSNNRGGGIFDFLPIHQESDVFERFFSTPHDLNFEHAARMFGLPYAQPNTVSGFKANYAQALQSQESWIIEIKTDRKENRRLHQDLFQTIKDL